MTYLNRKEKWWFHATRGMNLFAFRYWWLILLFFGTGLFLFYLFFWKNKGETCIQYRYALSSTNEAIEKSSNCCGCAPPADAIPCNTSASESGGQGYHENTHLLGDFPGKVTINFDMFNQKDKMDVFYDNKLVATTNQLVSGMGELKFYYPAQSGKPKYCSIVLTAPESGTSWQYLMSCPE